MTDLIITRDDGQNKKRYHGPLPAIKALEKLYKDKTLEDQRLTQLNVHYHLPFIIGGNSSSIQTTILLLNKLYNNINQKRSDSRDENCHDLNPLFNSCKKLL